MSQFVRHGLELLKNLLQVATRAARLIRAVHGLIVANSAVLQYELRILKNLLHIAVLEA
jgi:hypothetical protein